MARKHHHAKPHRSGYPSGPSRPLNTGQTRPLAVGGACSCSCSSCGGLGVLLESSSVTASRVFSLSEASFCCSCHLASITSSASPALPIFAAVFPPWAGRFMVGPSRPSWTEAFFRPSGRGRRAASRGARRPLTHHRGHPLGWTFERRFCTLVEHVVVVCSCFFLFFLFSFFFFFRRGAGRASRQQPTWRPCPSTVRWSGHVATGAAEESSTPPHVKQRQMWITGELEDEVFLSRPAWLPERRFSFAADNRRRRPQSGQQFEKPDQRDHHDNAACAGVVLSRNSPFSSPRDNVVRKGIAESRREAVGTPDRLYFPSSTSPSPGGARKSCTVHAVFERPSPPPTVHGPDDQRLGVAAPRIEGMACWLVATARPFATRCFGFGSRRTELPVWPPRRIAGGLDTRVLGDSFPGSSDVVLRTPATSKRRRPLD
ncbi:hypothetical protein VTN02DRAFT_2345 [Thermoascus thermophilus]